MVEDSVYFLGKKEKKNFSGANFRAFLVAFKYIVTTGLNDKFVYFPTLSF